MDIILLHLETPHRITLILCPCRVMCMSSLQGLPRDWVAVQPIRYHMQIHGLSHWMSSKSYAVLVGSVIPLSVGGLCRSLSPVGLTRQLLLHVVHKVQPRQGPLDVMYQRTVQGNNYSHGEGYRAVLVFDASGGALAVDACLLMFCLRGYLRHVLHVLLCVAWRHDRLAYMSVEPLHLQGNPAAPLQSAILSSLLATKRLGVVLPRAKQLQFQTNLRLKDETTKLCRVHQHLSGCFVVHDTRCVG